MKARDIMVREVVTVTPDMDIEELCDVLQMHNIKGVPVVDAEGGLTGVVTQDDVIYGRMGIREGAGKGHDIAGLVRRRAAAPEAERGPRKVREIMTSPAISADEQTSVKELCRMMWTLRIHRIPILTDGRVTGIVSSMDLCKAIVGGVIRLE